jgi:hypothetical protein
MKFLLLLYGNEAAGETPSEMPAERAAEWQRFHETAASNGALVSWQALVPSDTAATLRADSGGNTIKTDGPCAKTKEQLGGFYVLECTDMNEAVEYGSAMPCAPHGSIEIRQIYENE